MGPVISSLFGNVDFEISVKTGDVKGAGTDSDVFCTLIDKNGKKSRELKLDCKWKNDFERGNVDNFNIRGIADLDEVTSIILTRNEKGVYANWFVEYVMVKQYTVNGNRDEKVTEEIPFPCNRWVYPNEEYNLLKYDSVLPQFDPRKEQRQKELKSKQEKYKYGEFSEDAPRRVAECPTEENFSNDYQWDIAARKIKMLADKKFIQLFSKSDWTDLESLVDVYKGSSFDIPYGYYHWKSDHKFGQQRLRGCNPEMLELCTKLPENFPVTDEMLGSLLGGQTIEEAISAKKLYIVNLKVLTGINCKDDRDLCDPIALFHVNKEGDLLPVAIQLRQEQSDTNPIFTPNDPPNTWLLAKMYYNNSECCVHQTCTHLGFTHLVVEALCVAANITLSPSHPVFRLMAPHFLYLLAINTLAVSKLLSTDGWIDITMTMGVKGLFEILGKQWKSWRMDVNLWLPEYLKQRGVDDTEALPDYKFREDALMLHGAVYNYVKNVLSSVYDTPEKLANDNEVQDFAAVLCDKERGPGLKGVFGNGKFDNLEDLIKVVVSTIYTSSVAHAAANFCQYDEYAFPASYPAFLNGTPPTSKDATFTDKEVLDHLPDKETTLSIMVVTKLLSERGTNALGTFEVQYQYAPYAQEAEEKFQEELSGISKKIQERNLNAKEPYPYLDPKEIPNAISI